MATRTHYNFTTLSKVDAGKQLKSFNATLAYVEACDGDLALWRRQWYAIRNAMRTGQALAMMFQAYPGEGCADDPSVRDSKPDTTPAMVTATEVGSTSSPMVAGPEPHPGIRTVADLAEEMRYLKERSSLTFVELSIRTRDPLIVKFTGRPNGISVPALSNLCNAKCRRLASAPTLRGFLLAAGATRTEIAVWILTRTHLAAVRNNPSTSDPALTMLRNKLVHGSVEHDHPVNILKEVPLPWLHQGRSAWTPEIGETFNSEFIVATQLLSSPAGKSHPR